MSVVAIHLVALLLAFALCRLLLPVVMAAAWRFGWLDVPSDDRRQHVQPVPRLGGVGIVAAVVLAWPLASWLAEATGSVVAGAQPMGPLLPGVLIGGTTVFAIGVLDDLRGVSPRAKLLAQVVAALVVISYGLPSSRVALSVGAPVWDAGAVVGMAVSVLWIVGVTNAMNLIDGIDGLAGSVSVLALLVVVAVEWLQGDAANLLLSVSLLGAVLAFLTLNWRPARVFLGDSGSMTLGYFLAVRTVHAATDGGSGVVYPLVPLFALAFPVLDTLTAMARRYLRRHPFSRADGRHIHHQLIALGFSVPRAVQLIAAVFGAVGVLGVALVYAPTRLSLALLVGGVALVFVLLAYGVRYLGYAEFAEVGSSVASIVRNARTVVQEKVVVAEVMGRVGDAATLAEVRLLLAEIVSQTRLVELELLAPGEPARAELNRSVTSGHGGRTAQPAVRLDYPLSWVAGDRVHQAVLRVWAVRSAEQTQQVAERVANRVGPVLEVWLADRAHPGLGHREGGVRELRLG